MPRLTISIPYDLRQRLSDPRAKKYINISRICQNALDREVRRITQLPSELERFDLLISRMRDERQKNFDLWFIKGAEAARDWVENEAPYAMLRQFGEAKQDRCISLLRDAAPPGLLLQLASHRKTSGFSEKSYLEGWAHMTGLLWDLVERNL